MMQDLTSDIETLIRLHAHVVMHRPSSNIIRHHRGHAIVPVIEFLVPPKPK